MANLSITARCNRDCAYCFAMETLDKVDSTVSHMSLATFERALDFLERSGIEEGRLLGGEPTIHPHFCQMIDRVLERGLRLLIFSGGMIPPKVVDKLAQIPEDQVGLLINVIPPGQGHPSELKKQAAVYRRLGRRVTLGLNIVTPSVKLDFLLALINEYHLAPWVRLGLAHPILNGANEYLHPRQYPEVGRRVAAFGLRALQRGVRLSFDCGWVPCMFPEGVLEALGTEPDEVGLRCNPILDVLPDGKVVSCYPLATHTTEVLPENHDASWLRKQFETTQQPDRAFMLYQACTTCSWRARGQCTGGCLAGSMRRLRNASFSVSPRSLSQSAGQDRRRPEATYAIE